jgi:hypothetical protein
MTASSRPELSHLLDFSDRNNQRAHDILIVRQARRLLRDGTDDSDSLRADVRQQLKRLISLDSQSEILELLFDTDYLKLETIETFIEEILEESNKTSHLHNPQEILHLQEFCNNALHRLRICQSLRTERKKFSSAIHLLQIKKRVQVKDSLLVRSLSRHVQLLC